MKRRPSRARAAILPLLAIILLLGALLALELRDPDLFVRGLAVSGGAAPATEPVPTDPAGARSIHKMPGEASFAAISLRPLFSPTRRPPEQATTAAEAPTSNKAPSFDLTGIVSSGEGDVAIFEPARKASRRGPGVVVRVGDTIEGWAVEAIEFEARRVVLTKDGERLEMEQKADETRRPRTPPPGLKAPGAPVPLRLETQQQTQ